MSRSILIAAVTVGAVTGLILSVSILGLVLIVGGLRAGARKADR